MEGGDPATCDCAGTGVVVARSMVVATADALEEEELTPAMVELIAAPGELTELLPPAMTVATWVARVDG